MLNYVYFLSLTNQPQYGSNQYDKEWYIPVGHLTKTCVQDNMIRHYLFHCYQDTCKHFSKALVLTRIDLLLMRWFINPEQWLLLSSFCSLSLIKIK
jgi:hypothetical protein